MKTKLAIVAVGVAALGAAGVGTAFASTPSSSVRPVHTQVVQAPAEAPGTEVADAPGGPDVQQGDQSTPDTASSTEQAGSERPRRPKRPPRPPDRRRQEPLTVPAATPTRPTATPTPSSSRRYTAWPHTAAARWSVGSAAPHESYCEHVLCIERAMRSSPRFTFRSSN